MYVYTYMHMYVYTTYVISCTRAYMSTYTHFELLIYMTLTSSTYVFDTVMRCNLCIHMYKLACMYVVVSVCMHVCMYACIYVCMHA